MVVPLNSAHAPLQVITRRRYLLGHLDSHRRTYSIRSCIVLSYIEMAIFPESFLWSSERRGRCRLAFRVEADFAERSRSSPGFDNLQNLCSRGPLQRPTQDAAYLHLTWRKHWPQTRQPFESPFISLFTSYRSTLRRKDWLLRNGAISVTILVYDVSKDAEMLDAAALASWFSLSDRHFYRDEILATSKLYADDYNLLLVMPTTNFREIDIAGPWGLTTLPSDYWYQPSFCRDLLEALQLEVYSHTGWKQDERSRWLMKALRK